MSEDKRKMTNKGELFATCIADRERIFLIYKEVLQINKKKNGQRLGADKRFNCIKTCSASFISRKMKIKTTHRYQYLLSGWQIFLKTMTHCVGENVGKCSLASGLMECN